MAIPASGAVAFSDLQTTFGGSNPISLSEYYAGGSFVPAGTFGNSGIIPSTALSAINLGAFRNTGVPMLGVNWANLPSLSAIFVTGGTLYPIQCFASNGTTIVASGTGQRTATSTDGVNWTSQTANMQTAQGTTSAGVGITSIAYGAGLFVAVGNNGRGVTSPDGVTWTNQINYPLTTNTTVQIIWDGARFVVVSLTGEIAFSADGITWTTYGAVLPGFSVTFPARGIAYDGVSTYVAVGKDSKCATSTNLSSWTAQAGLNTALPTVNIQDIVWHINKFIVIGDAGTCATSPDGVTWTSRSGYGTAIGVTENGTGLYSNGTFTIAGSGNGKAAITVNGIDWTNEPNILPTPASFRALNAFIYQVISGTPKLFSGGTSGAAISPSA